MLFAEHPLVAAANARWNNALLLEWLTDHSGLVARIVFTATTPRRATLEAHNDAPAE